MVKECAVAAKYLTSILIFLFAPASIGHADSPSAGWPKCIQIVPYLFETREDRSERNDKFEKLKIVSNKTSLNFKVDGDCAKTCKVKRIGFREGLGGTIDVDYTIKKNVYETQFTNKTTLHSRKNINNFRRNADFISYHINNSQGGYDLIVFELKAIYPNRVFVVTEKINIIKNVSPRKYTEVTGKIYIEKISACLSGSIDGYR
jgi:hypothetical protein